MSTVLLFTYSGLNPGRDGYNENNLIIADRVYLFPLEVFDGRKIIGIGFMANFLKQSRCGSPYPYVSFIYTYIIHIYIYHSYVLIHIYLYHSYIHLL